MGVFRQAPPSSARVPTMSAKPPLSPLVRHVRRVRRRLFVASWLRGVSAGLAVALSLSVVWFLAQPWLVAGPPDWLRWAVAGSLCALAVFVPTVVAARRYPSAVSASLAIDDRFSLRERVTTATGLSERERDTAAGRALLADAHAHAAKLTPADLRGRFPLRPGVWPALALAAGAALAGVALWYEPDTHRAAAENGEKKIPAEEVKALDKKREEIRAKLRADTKPEAQKITPEKLREIQAELDKILSRPAQTREDVRERLKELTGAEDAAQRFGRDMDEKAKAIQQQLDQLSKLEKGEKKPGEKPGPADELREALRQGDMKKAKDEVDKLQKKAKNKDLSAEDKQKIHDKIKDLHDQVDKLSRLEDEKKELKKKHQEGKIDAETLEREMQKLDQKSKEQKDLQDLAKQLERAERALEQKDAEELADALEQAAQQLGQMGKNQDDIDDGEEKLQGLIDKLKQARDALGDAEDADDEDGADELSRRKRRGKSMNNKGGIGEGERDENKDAKIGGTKDERQAGRFNHRGQKEYAGAAPGQAVKRMANGEMTGEVRQMIQEASDAVEQSRIPKAAREQTKGYFRNLGGQQSSKVEK